MTGKSPQSLGRAVWKLASRQHGVIARRQLLERGFTRHAIEHRVARGRLHPIYRGVYAVGRPQLTQEGRWMAAVLACGPEAALSHASAAALWRIRPRTSGLIHVSVPSQKDGRVPGMKVHRRYSLRASDVTKHQGIPVTSPICTLIDITPGLELGELDRAINEADALDLVNPVRLRKALDSTTPRPGIRKVRERLDHHTFTLTDSELERLFVPLALRAGLSKPLTQEWVNGFKVDFYWPELGLIVETDGLRYHRTPAQQARDRRRDQLHTAAGLSPLRFTHAEIKYESVHVEQTLRRVAARLRAAA